jgi:hypothetical protein
LFAGLSKVGLTQKEVINEYATQLHSVGVIWIGRWLSIGQRFGFSTSSLRCTWSILLSKLSSALFYKLFGVMGTDSVLACGITYRLP